MLRTRAWRRLLEGYDDTMTHVGTWGTVGESKASTCHNPAVARPQLKHNRQPTPPGGHAYCTGSIQHINRTKKQAVPPTSRTQHAVSRSSCTNDGEMGARGDVDLG